MLIGSSDTQDNSNAKYVKDVTSETFMNEVIEESKSTPVIVDFWAPWCGPCRAQGPIVESLAGKFAGKATISKLDVDQNPTTAGTYNVMSIPTILIFKNGEMVEQVVGLQSEDSLESKLNSLI